MGDIMIGDHPLNAGRGAHSTFRSRPADFPFAHVASALGRADLAFGNLECTLSEHGLRPGDHRSMQLRGQISYAEALRHAGFSVLCVANNHSMQHGRQSFLETVDALRNAGVAVCGLAGTSYRTVVPEVLERNGLRIVFLGWSLRPRGYFASDPLYAEGYTADMLNDVRTARERHDCVVVTLHWGDEFVERPSPAEVEFAHDVMDAGADLLIGHHPHVLRGCERYGRGWILYSLGNFLGDMTWSDRMRDSVIAECRLTPDGVEDLKLVPVRIADDFRPTLLEGDAGAALVARLNALSAEIGRMSSVEQVSEESAAEYLLEATRALADERRRSRLHFLKNIRRLPPGLLVQQLSTFVRNRIAEHG
ncbi:MAG: CapA family protein [Steroidobacteraceae bacterium]